MNQTFMTGLHIYHVRHLRDIAIPISSQQRKSLILTGKNGSGKTSVLIALKLFLEYITSNSFCPYDTCQFQIDYYNKQLINFPSSESEKNEAANSKKQLKHWNEKLSYWTDGAVGEFNSYADLRSKYQSGEYILAFYGDDRKASVQISKNIEKIDLKNTYAIKEHPGHDLVKYLVNLKTTEAFAKTNGQSQRAEEIRLWFTRFEHILQEIYGDKTLKLNFDIETFAFTIQQSGREPFDFNTMSMGYAAVFDIVGDLMMRMESKCSYDIEGLVLIDEIETHLHVELQKKIVPILTELFPNIQFVLTTHSPFILNSTPNATVYDLENANLVENGLTDLPYEGIVEGYFKSDLLSQELRRKFDEYKSLVAKENLTNFDFAKASELEFYLDEVPDYLALDFSAEYNRLKLELSKRG